MKISVGAAALVVGGALLAACSTGSSDGATSRPSSSSSASSTASATVSSTFGAVADGTRARAQAMLENAESRLIRDGSAHFVMRWLDVSQKIEVGSGVFDLAAPAARQKYGFDGFSIETLLTFGHAWSQMSGDVDGRPLTSCWMHVTTGKGDEATAAAVLPVTLMMVKPRAVGLGSRHEDRVVVDLRLDEVALATMPQIANRLRRPIAPDATIRGVVTLDRGRYSSISYRMRDVLDQLDPADLPDEISRVRDAMNSLSVRVEYDRFGEDVVVTPPKKSEVVELGRRADILADPSAAGAAIAGCTTQR